MEKTIKSDHCATFWMNIRNVLPSYDDNKTFLLHVSDNVHRSDQILYSIIPGVDKCVDISRRFVVFGCKNNKITIINIDKQTSIEINMPSSVSDVKISPNETVIVSSPQNGDCIVWDIISGKELARYTQYYSVYCFTFSVTGDEIFSTTSDEIVHCWDISRRQTVKKVQLRDKMMSIAASKDLVAVVHLDSYVTVINAHTLSKIREMKCIPNFYSIAFSPDGAYLIHASKQHYAILWDAASGEEVAKLTSDSEAMKHPCFSLDGRTLALASGLALEIYNNFPLSVFLAKQNQNTKSILSFFHAVRGIFSADFNDQDEDNYLLMRIVICMK